MSRRIVMSRLRQPGFILPSRPSIHLQFSSPISLCQPASRGLSLFGRKKDATPENPTEMAKRAFQKSQESVEQTPPEPGSLTSASLLHPDNLVPGTAPGMSPEARQRAIARHKQRQEQLKLAQEVELSAPKLDPAAVERREWERERVIESIRRRGRVTNKIRRLRTERQFLWKSQFLPTSTKKLTRIMHLIAGKTVEDAIVQLRFSKKKAARDVLKGLQHARDEAIVSRGMGAGEAGPGRHQEIELKRKGRSVGTKVVRDETEIYVDQAYVGKGGEQRSPEYRAMGRVNFLTHRSTNFSVLLKEEKTRIRISNELKKKREEAPITVPLPDRPITTQRQYCLW